MPAPGVTFATLPSPPPVAAGPRTGVAFIAGLAQRGAVGSPISVQSMSDWIAKLGARLSSSVLYDWAETFFRCGGSQLYVSRTVGPGAAPATYAIKDAAAATIVTLTANGPGAWGNALTITVAVSSPTFVITIVGPNGTEISPALSTRADIITWATLMSQYVTAAAGASALIPAAVGSPASFTTGADDDASITDTIRVTALAAFVSDLGPGQVAIPGMTTATVWAGIRDHAAALNRTPLCDAADTPTAATLTAAAGAAQTAATGANADPAYMAPFAPWIQIPGLPSSGPLPNPPRTVPPSALVAGLMAKVDAAHPVPVGGLGSSNCNIAAMGPNGQADFPIGVSQTYTDSDRALLNAAGVNVVRSIAGKVTVYGYRTLALDPNWVQLTAVRLRMAIRDQAQLIGAALGVAAQLDGKGQSLAALGGAISGMLSQFWAVGALYGLSASDASEVDTGPSVNPPSQLATGAVAVAIAVRMSPFAETVSEFLVKIPITQPV